MISWLFSLYSFSFHSHSATGCFWQNSNNYVVNCELIYFQISIENDYLGPRRIESLQKEDADWQRKAHMAVLSIQDLTVKYFEITAKTQKGSYFPLLPKKIC